jgi:hypothetical protein
VQFEYIPVVDETSKVLAATLVAHLAETYGSRPLSIEGLIEGASRVGLKVTLPDTNPIEFFRTQPRREFPACALVNGVWICIGAGLPKATLVEISAAGPGC